ncbi:hypothetical protein PVAND_000940 [Polypedilum vanderplanki]|uniref:Lipase domain-containing protein n=1 Tax=Polypedilum vanderplanki TaxID=319348 RepID=A0A9J6BLQ9_POLVA|nr:hypothetical protein PVAND_000940 [Polypedilum vanderplanki]
MFLVLEVITGLDPAEPMFQSMLNLLVDLTKLMHKFVDVIHTDARSLFLRRIPGYGMSQACGHLDFYPNNGKEMPGCSLSQERNCALMGYHAQMPYSYSQYNSSENDVIPSESSTDCSVQGYYILTTGKDPHYCQRHYRFIIELAKPVMAEKWGKDF